MDFPSDLPWMIYYRMPSGVVRSTLPRKSVEFLGSSGATNAAVICPTIPLGADAWSMPGSDDWRPIDTIPQHWLPYLSRKRGTPHDGRSPN